jgi:hypothetical protein
MRSLALLKYSGLVEFRTADRGIAQIDRFVGSCMPQLVALGGFGESRLGLSKDVKCTHAQDGPPGDGKAVVPVKQMTPESPQTQLAGASLGFVGAMAGHGHRQGSCRNPSSSQ